MFWNRKSQPVAPSKPNAEALPGPKEIHDIIGRHLVVQMGKDPDRVWSLRNVLRPSNGKDKDAFDFRVFDKAEASVKHVTIRDYNTLDEHPELILYEGWFDKRLNRVQAIEDKRGGK